MSPSGVASIVIGILVVISFIVMVIMCFRQKNAANGAAAAAAAAAANVQAGVQTNPVYMGTPKYLAPNSNQPALYDQEKGVTGTSVKTNISYGRDGVWSNTVSKGVVYAVPMAMEVGQKNATALDEGGYVADGYNPGTSGILSSNA